MTAPSCVRIPHSDQSAPDRRSGRHRRTGYRGRAPGREVAGQSSGCQAPCRQPTPPLRFTRHVLEGSESPICHHGTSAAVSRRVFLSGSFSRRPTPSRYRFGRSTPPPKISISISNSRNSHLIFSLIAPSPSKTRMFPALRRRASCAGTGGRCRAEIARARQRPNSQASRRSRGPGT